MHLYSVVVVVVVPLVVGGNKLPTRLSSREHGAVDVPVGGPFANGFDDASHLARGDALARRPNYVSQAHST